MSDLLMELSQNSTAKSVIKTLGLPVPMPPLLERDKNPSEIRCLANRDIALHSVGESVAFRSIVETLGAAGAKLFCDSTVAESAVVTEVSEAYGQKPGSLTLDPEQQKHRFHGAVLDLTSITELSDIESLYSFFRGVVRSFRSSGRAVIVSRPPDEAKSAIQRAVISAIDGFIRSLSKELGRNGTTANWIQLEEGAEELIAGPLRFLLSARSAYVTAQPLRVSSQQGARQFTFRQPLEGKVALVTGAARGIGAATVKRLAQEGAKVICVDRPQDDQITSRLAREVDGEVCLVDVTSEDAALVLEKHILDRHGGLDILVQNAGITRDKTLGRMKPEIWQQVIDVNLAAVVAITERLVENAMKDNGRVICLSSIAGISGNPGQTNYAASKAAVIGLVRAWSGEHIDRKITFNAIAPGFIETRLTDAMPVPVREVGRRLNNLKQGGQPEDVAAAITFFAKPESMGMNGQVLRVCGGSLVGA
ncbi:MAG: 3-oxoacyl-ACP reductase [Myxococcota bacterium]|nr:3-oxoacyl-ACP reductase [Myxococcota bacterium]